MSQDLDFCDAVRRLLTPEPQRCWSRAPRPPWRNPPASQAPAAPSAPAPAPAAYPTRAFAAGVVGMMDVTYAVNRGFRPLKLDLYQNPAPAAPKALVLWVHGGAWQVGDQRGAGISTPAYQDWPKVLATLAQRGYVVAGVSYRLSGKAKVPAAIQDLKAAVRWLRANASTYGADPGRIVVWGGSSGGQLAALLGTSCGAPELEGTAVRGAEVSSCVQGVVDFYGPTDILQMDAQSLSKSMPHDSPTSAEAAYLGCMPSKCSPAQLRLSNPIAYVDRTDHPS